MLPALLFKSGSRGLPRTAFLVVLSLALQQEAAGQFILERVAAKLHPSSKKADPCLPAPQGGRIQASPAVVCQQLADPAPLTEAVAPTGQGPWSYQWQCRTQTTPWVSIEKAVGSSYDPPLGDYHDVSFRRMDLNVCSVVYSNEISIPLTEQAPLVITVPPTGPAAGSSGTEVVFELTPVAGAISYDWTASAGTISAGQGTSRLTLKLPVTDREITVQLSVAAVSTCSPGPATVVPVVCRPVVSKSAIRNGRRFPAAHYRPAAGPGKEG